MNSHPRILIVACSRDDAGQAQDVIGEAGCEAVYSIRPNYRRNQFNPDQHVGLIVLGDEMGNANQDRYSTERGWLCIASGRGIPVLGVCLGGQMIAYLTNTWRQGYRITHSGLYPVSLTPTGLDDPVLCNVAGAPLAQRHWSTFVAPVGACDLALSIAPAIQHSEAFRIGQRIYALQFHPEPTADMLMNGWFPRHRPRLEQAEAAANAGRKVLQAWVQLALAGNA